MITIGYGRYFYESWRNKGNIPPEEVDRYELTPMLLENMMKILLQTRVQV